MTRFVRVLGSTALVVLTAHARGAHRSHRHPAEGKERQVVSRRVVLAQRRWRAHRHSVDRGLWNGRWSHWHHHTNSVGVVRDAIGEWNFKHFATGEVVDFSFQLPIVGETWDGVLNDTYAFHVIKEDAWRALDDLHHRRFRASQLRCARRVDRCWSSRRTRNHGLAADRPRSQKEGWIDDRHRSHRTNGCSRRLGSSIA